MIELLVVIAIIGILSSVVLASLNTARQKSRDARRVADIKQMQLALELYYDSNNNAYPATTAPLAPTYIATIPKDPQGDAYNYAVSGTNYYHLGATLEDSGHAALNSDIDCNSIGTGCPAGVAYTNGFDGTVATVYDVTP